MAQGVHQHTLLASADLADRVIWANTQKSDWLPALVKNQRAKDGDPEKHQIEHTIEGVIERVMADLTEPCHIVIMSNGGFGGIHQRLVARLTANAGQGHD